MLLFTAMPDLFRYTHFSPYLRDWLAEQKSAGRRLSLQAVSKSIGLKSRSLLHRFLNDPQCTMSPAIADALSTFIGHNSEEREYFQYLALFSRARTPNESAHLYERMHHLLERLRPQYLQDWQLDYFKEWYLPVLREVVDLDPRPTTPEEIAKKIQPAITPSQVRRGLEALLRMGLIEKREREQGWQATQKALYTPSDLSSALVHGYQHKMIALAQEAHEHMGFEEREMIASTFSFPSADFARLRTMIRNFQQELEREVIALKIPSDQVFQLNLQLFPLSKKGLARSSR